MICNIDTNKTIEVGSKYILDVLDRLGLWGTIIFFALLAMVAMFVYVTLLYTKKFIHKKEYELEKLKQENKKVELQHSKKALLETNERYKENNQILRSIVEKLQFSLSLDQITTQTGCYIGIDRSFMQDIKAKLLFHVESRESEYMYLYHEVDIIFKQKVINKLKPSMFSDRVTFYKIEKECRSIIKQFLDDVKEHKDKDYINDNLIDFGNKLQEIILNNYKKQITGSSNVDYLKTK